VTAPKNAVRVTIGGEEYTVRSELPPEYTREVAAYVDAALQRVRDMLPQVETQKAAILAALAITDELFQARRMDREQAARLSVMADDLARLLPPTKRGRRAGGAGSQPGTD
jgi:cell division protein ZapA